MHDPIKDATKALSKKLLNLAHEQAEFNDTTVEEEMDTLKKMLTGPCKPLAVIGFLDGKKMREIRRQTWEPGWFWRLRVRFTEWRVERNGN